MNHTSKYFIFFILLIFFPINQLKANSYELVPPEFIENLNSKYEKRTHKRSRNEDWAFLNYIINDKGLIENVVVVEASSKMENTDRAISFIENFKFKPAKYNGKNTSYSGIFLYQQGISFLRNNNNGVSANFNRYYDEANSFISENNLDKAEKVLMQLNSVAKNRTEQAISAYLHSKYYFKSKDWTAYRDSINTAHILNKSLPTSYAIKNTRNLINWLLYKELYLDALFSLNSLKNVKSASMSEENYKASVASIKSALTENIKVEINTELSTNKIWMHAPARRTINLTASQGNINSIELRCLNTQYIFEETSLINYVIPDNFFSCHLLVKGEGGTKIHLVEQGELQNY